MTLTNMILTERMSTNLPLAHMMLPNMTLLNMTLPNMTLPNMTLSDVTLPNMLLWAEQVLNAVAEAGPVALFVVQDLLLLAGLIASLSLFFGMKREMRRHARRYQEALQEIEELLPRLRAAAEAPVPDSAPAASPVNQTPPSGLNLQRRAQALRLLRRGENVAHVSAVLGVPRGEVELLIRVQKLAAARAAGIT
jgi:hypothetical protein